MPYLLLGIGVLIGLYGLYRFFLVATARQVIALFAIGSFLAVCIALFFLAVTGRLPAAIGLVAGLAPFVLAWHQHRAKRTKANENNENAASSGNDKKPMTRKDALEILGLEDGAGPEEIKAAYKRLMKKVHPDQEGSEWMAAKLNQARDILLK